MFGPIYPPTSDPDFLVQMPISKFMSIEHTSQGLTYTLWSQGPVFDGGQSHPQWPHVALFDGGLRVVDQAWLSLVQRLGTSKGWLGILHGFGATGSCWFMVVSNVSNTMFSMFIPFRFKFMVGLFMGSYNQWWFWLLVSKTYLFLLPIEMGWGSQVTSIIGDSSHFWAIPARAKGLICMKYDRSYILLYNNNIIYNMVEL